MRYIVRARTKGDGAIQVVAAHEAHALEAATLMINQGLTDVSIEHADGSQKQTFEEFEIAFNSKLAEATSPPP